MARQIDALDTLKQIRNCGLEKEYISTLINKLENEKMASLDHNNIEITVDSSTSKYSNKASISCIIRTEHGELRESKVIDSESEHVSDLESIKLAIEKLQGLGIRNKSIVLYADNLPLVSQLNGLSKVNKRYIREYFNVYAELCKSHNITIEYKYHPRECNRLADKVAKNAVKREKAARLVTS